MDVGSTGLTAGAAGGGATGGVATGINSQELLAKQASAQNEAMTFQTESTNQTMKFQMHSAAEKNRGAVATAVNALMNQQSQAIGRA